jgi:nitroreductase
MDAIYKRRSIRKYTNEPVDRAQLKELIKAGMNAPSANNQQPWHFVIIDERKLLDEIPEFHPYAQMLKAAPAAILVCGDRTIDTAGRYWVQDCSAATENILLEIADCDLGGVWLGVYPREDRVEGIRNLLNLPPHIIPFSIVSIGHPAETKPPKNIFDESRIHQNGW